MNKTLSIKGRGRVSKAPDQMEVTFTLHGRNKEYEKAMDELNKKQHNIHEDLEQLDINPSELKTISFDVTEETKEKINDDGSRSQEFVGYKVSHTLILKRPLDKELLGSILESISKGNSEPQLVLRFTLKEPEALKKELLKNATEDALEKAKIITEASGVILGELISINYDVHDPSLVSATRFSDRALGASYQLDFEPTNIEEEDEIDFVWRIE